jgi:hypothetical protein
MATRESQGKMMAMQQAQWVACIRRCTRSKGCNSQLCGCPPLRACLRKALVQLVSHAMLEMSQHSNKCMRLHHL